MVFNKYNKPSNNSKLVDIFKLYYNLKSTFTTYQNRSEPVLVPRKLSMKQK